MLTLIQGTSGPGDNQQLSLADCQKNAIRTHCVFLVLLHQVSLVGWISDTRSQKYTGLQSLVKCLDHRGFISDTCIRSITACRLPHYGDCSLQRYQGDCSLPIRAAETDH